MSNAETTYVSPDDRVIEFDEALARAWANIRRAAKDGTDINKRKADGSARKYVTLASVDDAIRDALTAEGFTYPQPPSTRVDDRGIWIVIHTQIRRKGVAFVPEPYALLVQGGIMKGGEGFKPPTAQDMGSALTYARRYALTSVFGVCPDEDDDGHKASHGQESKPDPLWEAYKTKRAALQRALRVPERETHDRILAESGVTHGNDPTDAEVERMIAAAERLMPPREEPVVPKDRDRDAAKGEINAPAKAPRDKAKPAAEKPTKPKDPTDLVEARAQFQIAYRRYQAECKEQGEEPKPWLDLASEAIGEAWNTTLGAARPPAQYILAADACEQAIKRMRSEGAAA